MYAVIINDFPKDAEVAWNVLGGGSWGDATATPLTPEKNQAYFARYVGLRGKSETLGLRVGIASGPWVTSVKGEGLQANGILGTGIIFSGAFAKDDGCVVVVSHNLSDVNVRVIAIDKTGKQHVSQSLRQVSATGGLNQSHWFFKDLKPEEVDHFEFQTRLYEWTEIKDLPVEPGERAAKIGNKPQSPESQTPVDSAKIEALKELVEAYETDYERVEALFRSGVAGGEPATKAQAQVRLALARADLAEAEDNPEERLEQLSIALVAVEEAVQALEHMYAAGTATLGDLSEAKAERARIKMLLATAKEATEETGRINENVRSGASWPEINDLPVERGETDEATSFDDNAKQRSTNKYDPARPNAVVFEEGYAYEGVDLRGRTFVGQTIRERTDRLFDHAELSDTTLEKISLHAGVKSFYAVDFSSSDLNEVELSSRAGFQKTNFGGSKLVKANLDGGDAGFQQCDFSRTDISSSQLRGGVASFQLASFASAVISDTTIEGGVSAFQGANFSYASLSNVALVSNSPVAFQGVSLNSTEFINVDLSTIDAEALKSCKFHEGTPPEYNSATKFPEGFDPKKQGWKLIERGEP